MKLNQLVKDRKFQAAAAVVVLVALYVGVKRRGTSGGNATGGNETTSGGTVYSTVPSNTTATDVASWMGDYSGSLQTQLNQYSTDLAEQIKTLQKLGTGDSGNGTNTGEYINIVAKNAWDWDQLVYNAEQVNPENTVTRLMQLNPDMQPNVGPDNRFKSSAIYKILAPAKKTTASA